MTPGSSYTYGMPYPEKDSGVAGGKQFYALQLTIISGKLFLGQSFH